MIVHKPADLDPAMKLALKNHIMRKRQQLKQEMEQDAIEKRLKREQEAKRKQDAMTLDQLKEQLCHLEKNLENLKSEKHTLFAQLKQNMRVLNEDDARRKQKEGERLQQNNEHSTKPTQLTAQQQNQNHQEQHLNLQPHAPQPSPSHQPSITNGPIHPSIANQENHAPALRDKAHEQIPSQQPQLFHHQQPNHAELELQPNSHSQTPQPTAHSQRPNSIFNSPAAYSHLINPNNFPRQQPPFLPQLPQSSRPSLSYGSPYQSLGHQIQASLISGHGIPTSISHVPQGSPMIRPSPPPSMPNSSNQLNTGPLKLPTNLPITSSGPPTNDFNPNLVTSTAHQIQQAAMNNAAVAALTMPYASPFFNSNSPIGAMNAHALEQHQAVLNAANVAAHNHMNNNNNNNMNSIGAASNMMNHSSSNPNRNNLIQSMKRPISATGLSGETLSPSKKIHTQAPPPPPPPPGQNQPHPVSIANPYFSYPGLPSVLGSSSGPSLPANLLSQNLIRTPPPPDINSLFNTAAFSHLLNAHNFPRQSPYLTHAAQRSNPLFNNPAAFSHLMNANNFPRQQPPFLPQLPQSSRPSLSYGSPYQSLGHQIQASLISGHGIPTSISHVPQGSPMIRPSPPPSMPNSSNQLNTGPLKLPTNLPITSSGPPTNDFNPNLVTSTAHQIQQAAMNNAAVAALTMPYASPFFNSNSPIGASMNAHALEQHQAVLNAASAAAAASAHNHLAGNSNNNS